MTSWRVAALAGALLWGACSKEAAPAQAPAPPLEPAAPAAEPTPSPAAEPMPPSEEPQAVTPPAGDMGPPPVLKVGQSRDEVMSAFGNCAERRVFIPPGPGSLYVEVYQAKEDQACRKHLGERHFTIRGGSLYQITPGLIPPPPPPGPPAEG